MTRSVLGRCYAELGRTAAADLLRSGRDLLVDTRGEDSRLTVEATQRLQGYAADAAHE